MKPWQAFLWQRSRREKLGLLIAAGVILAAALYAGLWQPLNRTRAELAARLPILEDGLATMRAQAQDAARLTAQTKPRARLDAKMLIASAQSEGLSLTLRQHEPPSERRIAFHLAHAPIDRVLGFIETLRRQGGWQVTELKLARVGQSTVNADVVMENL